MDGPDLTVALTSSDEGAEGADHSVSVTWTAHTVDGRAVERLPDTATFTVRYQDGLRRIFGGDRDSRYGRVSAVGKTLVCLFRLERAGRVDVRADGSLTVNGATLSKAASHTLYVRRNRTAA